MIWDTLVFWHWWTLGTLLLILELLVPGMYFLWMAEAALVTGAVLWLFPELGWEVQLLLFSVLSLASIFAFEKLIGRKPIASDRPLLNRRAAQYLGRTLTLEQPIVNGMGKIHIDDSIWRVCGEDCPAGTKVKVSDVEGVILKVERID
ncbi:NfeD family protein [Methylococcus geothermalis]|uniref:NfeD family protein n=1 Tax=Methylococcus geothermalis TaxID=2681310 RepID=A0A858Q503_9GAMM|nr:NfeD family protein [Methylococcus geothermalis]QJD28919.1 NfeD family protein [Methylococcus geothermalis]